LLGLWMGATKNNAMRRVIVALNVAANVGMLVYFKYTNLLLDSLSGLTGGHFDALDIILPAGISFFTFRSISYIVDLYRRQMAPERNLLDYIFFLTFFPPLLAGPVVRAKDMLPQVKANSPATPEMTAEGLFMIMTGLIKKVVIADYISGNFVDRIFDNPSLYSGFENLMGCLGFTLQLYCDFSGYSDMAIGIALLLGYRFKANFDAPFKSQNPTEFWRRWHISLSSWLRDYIYIPLGGNRKGKWRQRANLMATMLIGGLWHGASWMYVLWGAYHGALLVAHKALSKVWHAPRILQGTALLRGINTALTFALIVTGFTFFRASGPEALGDMAVQIFTDFRAGIAGQFAEAYMLITIALAAGYVMHFTPRVWTTGATRVYAAMPLALQALLLSAVLFLVIQTRQTDLVPFIYLQY
ncbi:MAG: MBOAT family protein, partial [Muribaculaceae bacterium]|nr:MBOAT family protein [Muribaculaceae bacterium]